MPFCVPCSTSVEKNKWIGHLRSNAHKTTVNSNKLLNDGVEVVESAFRMRIATYRISASNDQSLGSIDAFMNSIRDKIKRLLDNSLMKHTCVKVNFELFGMFLMFKDNSQSMKSFGTKNKILYRSYDFEALFCELVNCLKKKSEEFQDRDSGWAFVSNSHLEININKYQPLRGSSYVDLPKFIKNKKACLNIQNNDQCCFLWCVTAALHPSIDHPERVSSYPNFRDVLNISQISFPITFDDIRIFEKKNPMISLTIFGLKNNKIVVGPLYKSEVSSEQKSRKNINLLLIDDDTHQPHYVLIKDLSRLVRRQVTKHNSKIYFCETCLLFFLKQEELANHLCTGIVTVLPEKGTVIKFKHFDRKQNVPFVIYADFESLLEPTETSDYDTDTTDRHTPNTTTLHHHIPAAFGYYIVCNADPSHNRYFSYRGTDCVDRFIKEIYKDVAKIYRVLSTNTPIIFNENDELNFLNAKRCHICNHFLFSDRVRDHCHITGSYRGAAHSLCNLQYKRPSFVPIFFHNLSGYDCHLFIKKLGEAPGNVKVIPKTKENYISFTKFIPIDNEYFQLRFVDSFKFLDTSLEKLTTTMQKSDFLHLRKYFCNDKEFNLLTRKGVFPYEYMNKWQCFEEKYLPPIEYFNNALTNEEVSLKDYNHAQSVWNQFKIRNLGEYTDLYLQTDVLLLTDIFEKFRATCKQHYDLDPAFYLTTPSLSFDAMLLKTGIELELIDDFNMLKMIQSGIRGGVCMASLRYAKANNIYLPHFDPSQLDSFLIYIDCNNLYGHSMCQYMPLSNFRFLQNHEINALNITQIPDDSDYGYILEVDIIYPKDLHVKHNDLPFCPEKCIPPGGTHYKLVPNLYDKYSYVIHYIHLKTCLKHGLKLKKIHRVITFKQSPYLKQYIDMNTRLRQEATSVFEQDFCKLMNNSIFGKTLENTEKRVDVCLVNQWADNDNKTKKKITADRLIARPNFHSASVFTENLVAIQLKPDLIILDKPIYIGFAVLELSKSHMYDFHYSVFKRFYDNRLQMCYTDTDSFLYYIHTKDYFKDLRMHFLSYFDTSCYDVGNKFLLPVQNKKVPGLFKDEMEGDMVKEFVALRSKVYSIKTIGVVKPHVIKKAKGVKEAVIRNLKFSQYEKSLFQGDVIKRKNILFKSIKHEIFTQSVNKVALSAKDDKRLICDNQISTKAWGHTSILNV